MQASKIIISIVLLLLYSYFCFLMISISWQYISFDTDIAFLRIKQDVAIYKAYQIPFFIHVFFSILALPAGFTQFSSFLRKKNKGLHRNAGYVYSISILFFAAPSGLVLAIFANGGWSSQLAFILLAVGWFYFTLMAMIAIKKGDFEAHRRFMIRSFAFTLSAITLRLWKMGLVHFFQPRPMDVYRWVAWLGWVVNLIIAEFIIFKFYNKKMFHSPSNQKDKL